MQTLIKSTTLAITLTLASIGTAYATTPASPQQAANNLIRQLSSIQNFSADFQQTTRLTQARKTNTQTAKPANQSFSGTMSVARPGKFYWETRLPAKQIIATSGQTVWVYDPDLQQAIKQNLDQQIANTPALLLSGNAQQIMQAYNIQQPDAKKTYYALTPKSKDSAFEKLWLSFGANNTPTLMILQDATGQTTSIRFNKGKINSKLNSALFNFTPPKGTDIIEQ